MMEMKRRSPVEAAQRLTEQLTAWASEVQGLSADVRLILEGIQVAQVAQVAQGAAQTAPGGSERPDPLSQWLYEVGRIAVAEVNECLHEVLIQQKISASDHNVVRMRDGSFSILQNMIQTLDPYFNLLSYEAHMQHVADRYANLQQQMARWEDELQQAVDAFRSVEWLGEVTAERPKGKDLVELVSTEKGTYPQLRLQVLVQELEVRLNQVLQERAATLATRPPAGDPQRRLLEHEMRTLELVLHLKHAVQAAVQERGGDENAGKIVAEIKRSLKSVGVKEFEAAPGDAVNHLYHEVVGYERDSPPQGPNRILRVIVPGYEYKGRRVVAQVVVTR